MRNESETIFPAEGAISEGHWGTYMLENQGAFRKIRIGVSNDTYTRAEIMLENNNTAHGKIYFRTSSSGVPAATRMMIQSNGNVGIGTIDPKAKLAVDGNILAKEIKVKTDITVPDYVFEETYNLPTLSSIENYVKEHKHLPEIPSAKDIESDGLDLAEMNLLLLKKVEELTLHLIEKDKQVNELSERVLRLEANQENLRFK
ncbi:hypothetical protein C5745_18855 [Sphingobacterium haloxyli]|uniref:Peptidase S74 domain-containing protein n=1 Tax=Sphingobacterium haloxyli TaxID=2100533 RepID=A0A2S9IWR8_9SPHI|nr:hypothetical protein C5745_18855 [Sphingobacterium haloxyli]